MEIIENRFKQPRICFKRRFIKFRHRDGRWRIEQLKRWQNKAAEEVALSCARRKCRFFRCLRAIFNNRRLALIGLHRLARWFRLDNLWRGQIIAHQGVGVPHDAAEFRHGERWNAQQRPFKLKRANNERSTAHQRAKNDENAQQGPEYALDLANKRTGPIV